MSNVRYRHIVADYEGRFRYQVRSPHCRLWRMANSTNLDRGKGVANSTGFLLSPANYCAEWLVASIPP